MLIDGTTYTETPTEIAEVIERARKYGWRIRVHYGDRNFGTDWGDLYDVTGYVGRSLGAGEHPIRVPLLLHNARSRGGSAILTKNIVRIRFANRKDGGDLWRHACYTPPNPDEFLPDVYERNFS